MKLFHKIPFFSVNASLSNKLLIAYHYFHSIVINEGVIAWVIWLERPKDKVKVLN